MKLVWVGIVLFCATPLLASIGVCLLAAKADEPVPSPHKEKERSN